MMKVRRRLWPLGVTHVITVALNVLMLMIMATEQIKCTAGRIWYFDLVLPMISELESESFWLMLDFFSTWGGFFYCMFGSKSIFASLTSFVVMFTLTSYLLHLTLRCRGFKSKTAAHRRRMRSCLWTRRRVFWLQKGKSRSAYLLKALERRIKARAYCGIEAREETEQGFTKS